MKSIIAALLFGALAIVATPTTASAKAKSGKTYNWVYQIVKVYVDSGRIREGSRYLENLYVLRGFCEAEAKRLTRDDSVQLIGDGTLISTYVCIRKQL